MSAWSDTLKFRLIDLPDTLDGIVETEIHDQNNLEPGFTLTSAFGTVLGFDKDGLIHWFLPNRERGWFYGGNWDIRQLPSGQFLSMERRGIRLFSVENTTIWHSKDFVDYEFHHEVFPMPDGSFIGLVSDYRDVETDGVTKNWFGDNLYQLDRNGRIIWEWICWDNLSTEDYDVDIYSSVPEGGAFSWTHTNACPFVVADSSIYLSIRNLDRVVKID